jgi:hypothetical protein
MEEWPPILRVAVNIYLISSRSQPTVGRGGVLQLGFGEVLTTHSKNWSCYKMHKIVSSLD